MSTLRSLLLPLTVLLCGLGVAIANNAAQAAAQPAASNRIFTQIDRYSVVAAGPTAGQRDLLAVIAEISIPNEIDSVGDAVRWVLRDSGYRLAADSALSEEVHAMFKLPLPAAHRHFEPMPLYSVLGLLVGPAFHIVQDPLHRLLAFERCDTTPVLPSIGGAF
ncbi:MAG: pili assembly chaperone [Gammaproteobacteria bacterium]|nr:pili assembly chaperone [Gammaproteobacteria bacterium]